MTAPMPTEQCREVSQRRIQRRRYLEDFKARTKREQMGSTARSRRYWSG
jgi:hypothetical protein